MSAADLAVVRRNFLTRNPAALARYDVNADGVVNAFDLAVVRSNLGRDLAVVAAPAPVAPAGVCSTTPLTTATLSRRGVWGGLEANRGWRTE
jgi:hypothetical protein